MGQRNQRKRTKNIRNIRNIRAVRAARSIIDGIEVLHLKTSTVVEGITVQCRKVPVIAKKNRPGSTRSQVTNMTRRNLEEGQGPDRNRHQRADEICQTEGNDKIASTKIASKRTRKRRTSDPTWAYIVKDLPRSKNLRNCVVAKSKDNKLPSQK